MFLHPQHFQQQDRYVQALLEARCAALCAYSHGFSTLQLDTPLLAQGKVSVVGCEGVLPDGTPFECTSGDSLPAPIDIADGANNQLVYLALPVRRAGAVEVEAEGTARYRVEDFDLPDTSRSDGHSEKVQIGHLGVRLLTDHDALAQYSTLPLACIAEKRADGGLILDDGFVAPCLDVKLAATPALQNFAKETLGMLKTRAEALAGRVSGAGRGGVAEVSDFLLLNLVNRYQPLFHHLTTVRPLHPERLYSVCLELAGELAGFTLEDRLPKEFAIYQHNDLAATFAPLMLELRRALSVVIEQNAISLPMTQHAYGIRVAEIPDRSLLTSAIFVLAVNAEVSSEVIRQRFPAQAKMGPVERIRDLVNLQLPGLALHPLSVAPREIPYHVGFSYFELDKTTDIWTEFEKSGGIALHVAGEFPGIDIALWAIRR